MLLDLYSYMIRTLPLIDLQHPTRRTQEHRTPSSLQVWVVLHIRFRALVHNFVHWVERTILDVFGTSCHRLHRSHRMET